MMNIFVLKPNKGFPVVLLLCPIIASFYPEMMFIPTVAEASVLYYIGRSIFLQIGLICIFHRFREGPRPSGVLNFNW